MDISNKNDIITNTGTSSSHDTVSRKNTDKSLERYEVNKPTNEV